MRQRLRVQPIGLRQAPGGSGEVAHLAGIDHHDRKVGNTQLRHEGRLIASGRLDHDHLGADRLQPHHQLSAPRRVIAQLTLVAARADGHLQRRFGPIDPNDHVLLPLPNFFLRFPGRPRRPGLAGYGLSAWLALATVRAPWGEARDDPSSFTASRDRGTNGLSRPPAASHCAILHDFSHTRD